MPSGRMVKNHRGDHYFVRSRCLNERQQPLHHRFGASDNKASALARDALAVDRCVRIRGGLVRRGQRRIFALGAANVMQVGA